MNDLLRRRPAYSKLEAHCVRGRTDKIRSLDKNVAQQEISMQKYSGIPSQVSSTARLEQAIQEQAEVGHVQVAAYYLAQKRGFASGHALEDWLEAQKQLRGSTT
jgi:hypothetical protein